jgi:hypothetical protein
MDAKTIKSKLDEFIRLGNELDAEAKSRYGKNGWLFHEADGGVYIMSGDDISGGLGKRRKYIKAASTETARWGAGAW